MSERDVIFRETFLRRFSDAEERETLQRFGALVLSMAIGDERLTEGRESLTGSELAAAVADLRRVSEYLRGVAEGIEGNEVEPAEAHLAYLARRWSNQVAELTDAIERVIAEAEADSKTGAARPAPAPTKDPARYAWLRHAQHGAKCAEEGLRAIPEDGPDTDLHGHLIVRASDLSHELRLLVKTEGFPPEDEP